MIAPIHQLTVNELANHRSQFALFVCDRGSDREYHFHNIYKLLKPICQTVVKSNWAWTAEIYGKLFSIRFVDDINQVRGLRFQQKRPTLITFDHEIQTKYYAAMSHDGFRMIFDKKVIDAIPKSASSENLARVSDANFNAGHCDDHCVGDGVFYPDQSDKLFQKLAHQPLIPAH